MPYANNITVTTGLSYCDNTTWNFNRTLYDLRNLYENNMSNLTFNIFSNISIINLNCSNTIENSFTQIISFTQSVSIRIQILFVSIYFDYLNANNFQLNGLIIDRESLIKFSSITVNNIDTSNACSSAEIAQDPLCPTNLVCNQLSNPWNFNCSQEMMTPVISLWSSTRSLESVVISTGLNSWQIGLISSLSVVFVLCLVLLFGFFYRRYRHSKHLALSNVNLYIDIKSMEKSGIPQGQAFQRVATILQPKRSNHTATSWIHDGTAKNRISHDQNYINLKPAEPYNQVTFVDHAKIHDPAIPSISNISVISPSNRTESTIQSQSVSKTSLNKFHESDNILFNQSLLNNTKIASTPISRQFSKLSSIEENLTDEDAWMSILDVVNAELAILNEQDRIGTSM